MQQFVTPTMTMDEVARAQARVQAARESGHKFIPLDLVDLSKNRVGGCEFLNVEPYTDVTPHGNVTRYNFHVMGGEARFEYSPIHGMYRYEMLDTEHNRKFLASHYSENPWKILDKEVEKDVIARAKRIKPVITPEQGEVFDPVQQMNDEQFDEQLAKMTREKERRERVHKNAGEMRDSLKSVRGEEDEDESRPRRKYKRRKKRRKGSRKKAAPKSESTVKPQDQQPDPGVVNMPSGRVGVTPP
jgi:hypothetical protein